MTGRALTDTTKAWVWKMNGYWDRPWVAYSLRGHVQYFESWADALAWALVN